MRMFGRDSLLANGIPKPEITDFLRGLVLLAYDERRAARDSLQTTVVSYTLRLRRALGLPDKLMKNGRSLLIKLLRRRILMHCR